MFEIRNKGNAVFRKVENFEVAKALADECAKAYPNASPFSIFEVKQVWTTQTLDEAIKG